MAAQERSIGPVVVLGATGYVGGRLVPRLLAEGYRVRVVARTPEKVAARPWGERVEVFRGDVMEPDTLTAAFDGAAAVYHLVHAMSEDGDFERAEAEAARHVRDAAAAGGVEQIIYLGGLGDARDGLSRHLHSRQQVGHLLREGPVPVTELRAAVIIGSGSASFEMLRALVERLPVMITPRWVNRTRVQPVAVTDVLDDLIDVLGRPDALDRVLDEGGPEVVTYEELMHRYATVAGLRRRLVVPVPLLTPRLSAHWVNLTTPIPRTLAGALIDSLSVDVVVRPDHDIAQVVARRRKRIVDAIGEAITEVRDREPASWWTDASLAGMPAQPWSYDPSWAGPKLYVDRRETVTDATADCVFQVLSRLGGRIGWLSPRFLWKARGLADKLLGGVGLSRGRRSRTGVRVGDAVDFWRVEAARPGELLRLRAEMLVPGRAWLEWAIEPADDGRTAITQRAIYHPLGAWGRVYWWVLVPFHRVIFPNILTRLVAEARAEQARTSTPTPSPTTPTSGAVSA